MAICGWTVIKDVASVEQSLNTLISNSSHIKMDYLSCTVTICRIHKPYDEARLLSVHGNCRSHWVL